MKKILFSALPLAAIALLALLPAADPLPIGSSLPNADVKMKDISGKEISFKDATKKNGLLVMFSCNTCPIVHQYEERTVEACKSALASEVGVILLNSNEANRKNGDSYEDMQDYAKEKSYSFHYVLDNKSAMADAFGANRTPECFLFNKEGKLVYHGAIDDNPDGGGKPYLTWAIKGLVKGDKIDPENTRSVGCTIKRTK
jgi:thioredoxin-related protein